MKEFIVGHIYEICLFALSLITNIGTFISYIKARRKVKTVAEQDKLKAEAIERFKTTIDQWIKDAEKLKHYTGEECKQFVMTRALAVGSDLMTTEEIDAYVEKQVDLTNNVNVSKIKKVV